MGEAHLDFTNYNREERDICAHLFRLLLEDQPVWGPLCQFLGVEAVSSPRVYCEVALIRDAYFIRKPDTEEFMADLVELVARQEGIGNHTPFLKLPDAIRDPSRTHPKQIRFKLRDELEALKASDNAVYGAIQGMFNAKPDLAICDGGDLYVYEAKYTLGFDRAQLRRTECIGQVWSELLFGDLGFSTQPKVVVRTLGLERFSPSVSWERVHDLAVQQWGEDDFSTRVLGKALRAPA